MPRDLGLIAHRTEISNAVTEEKTDARMKPIFTEVVVEGKFYPWTDNGTVVFIRRSGASGAPQVVRANTDFQSCYRTRLAAGASYTGMASAPPNLIALRGLSVPQSGPFTLDFQLIVPPPPPKLFGRVSGRTRAGVIPVPDVSVIFTETKANKVFARQTDTNGEYTIPDFPEGCYSVTAAPPATSRFGPYGPTEVCIPSRGADVPFNFTLQPKPIELTDANFDDVVLKSPIPVFVELYRDGCPFCELMEPELSRLCLKYEGEIEICRLNIWVELQAAAKVGVGQSVPQLNLFRDGVQIAEPVVGALRGDALDNWINDSL